MILLFVTSEIEDEDSVVEGVVVFLVFDVVITVVDDVVLVVEFFN